MAVPRGKHTKSRRNKGRMHLLIREPTLVFCPKCKELKKPHTICWHCGFYNGKEIIDVLGKLSKKEKKKREKELKAKEEKTAEGKAKKTPLSWKGLSKR